LYIHNKLKAETMQGINKEIAQKFSRFLSKNCSIYSLTNCWMGQVTNLQMT